MTITTLQDQELQAIEVGEILAPRYQAELAQQEIIVQFLQPDHREAHVQDIQLLALEVVILQEDLVITADQ